MLEAAVAGYLVALSLIAAIGAQNAFVLRQGLRREHVGIVVAICAISDALLISVGVGGFGHIAQAMPMFATVMRWLGVAFLAVYGAQRFRAAWQGGEALMPRIAGRGPWPVQFVLHLAHRGQVNVSAGYAAQGWHITLGAQQAGTRNWLARQRQACQRRLGRALGQPVSLQLMAQYL